MVLLFYCNEYKCNMISIVLNRCRSTFSCVDCLNTFDEVSYRTHNSCISEAEKTEGILYKNVINLKIYIYSNNIDTYYLETKEQTE